MTRVPLIPERSAEENALLQAMAAIAPRGVGFGCRLIREGDEAHLLPGEAGSIAARRLAMRRASGAARWIAHGLLSNIGIDDFPILRTPSGAPVWPDGITGSLAHDDEMAVAAIAPIASVGSLGIDVEPAIALPDDVAALVVIGADAVGDVDRQLAGRVLFAAKEAVYKAVYPLDGRILDYGDIAVDLGTGRATTTSGRRATLAYCVAPRIVVLAFVR